MQAIYSRAAGKKGGENNFQIPSAADFLENMKKAHKKLDDDA